MFKNETAGLTEHPSELFSGSSAGLPNTENEEFNEEVQVLIESTGVSDPEGVTIPGRSLNAYALRNIANKGFDEPDLQIFQSTNIVPEYNNANLFPGMYPTLFPFGLGGLDDPKRKVKVSFQKHVDYLFSIHDRSFRYHNSFMFVALNIHQRRLAHLHTYFTVKRSDFLSVAEKLVSISPITLQKASETLQSEKSTFKDLGDDEKEALRLLKEVNAVTTHIPGSQAAKIRARNEIMSYVGAKGVAQLFLTINPCPQHSPVFQVMFGDTKVDLDERYPSLVPGKDRAERLAKDPVAASDFFDLSIECIFEDLFGWDYGKGMSSDAGGILGKLDAFYGTVE
ncbi:hypothetical protein SCHPADRAFT_837061, partial [Schizopora paradoxa]